MAFVAVPGSNDIWYYDNEAIASDSYSDAKGIVSNGIRSFTRTFDAPTRVTQNTEESTGTIFTLDSVDDIMTGFVVTGTDIVGTVTIESINRVNNQVVLSSEQTIGAEHTLTLTRPSIVTETYIVSRKKLPNGTLETHLDTSLETPAQVPTLRGNLNKDYYDQKHADGTP